MWIRRCSEKKWVQSWLKNQRQKPKNRSRNIIRFNPRFNKAVLTNIAKIFLRLINRHFPKSHRLHKIFNRNTVKVSYSCMQNMSKIYKGHNSKITSAPCNHLPLCNCWEKVECPMDGKCQTMDAVYDCPVTSFIVTRKNIVWKLARGYCLCYCKTFSLVPDSTECTKILLPKCAVDY